LFEIIKMIMVNGLTFGGAYALLAVGFSLIFGVAKILNIAHTGFYMIIAFLIFVLSEKLGFPLLLSLMFIIPISYVIGISAYKLFFDRIKEHETAVLIISIGLTILFQEILLLLGFGSHYRRIRPFVSGFAEIAGIRVSNQHLFAICANIVVLTGVWFLLLRTKLGSAIRAVAQDREVANVMGIDVSRICMITMGLSIVLAGIAAAIVAPITTIHPRMWISPLVTILAVVVLGGLGSIKGSIIAAFILGFAETSIIFLVPMGSFLKGAFSLGIMIIILLIRPEGLFGVAFGEERL
jgi:branched-chain amino acid transport system permease protein